MQTVTLIIGYGDIARRSEALLVKQSRPVVVVGRGLDPHMRDTPLRTVCRADLDQPESLARLPVAGARILYLAPPPVEGTADSRTRNFCAELTRRLPDRPQGVVYVSTSGVYGDCPGELVDESHPLNPQTDRARRRVDAETTLRGWGRAHRVPVVILRVAGIYGPGRLPLQRLQAGMPVLRPDQAPVSNRIHADDLARTCLAALERVAAQGVFNVCDGEASSMSDYFLAVARIFNLPPPALISRTEAQQQYSEEMLSYLNESRRLDNRRLLQDLGVVLQYPTLDAGLLAIRRQLQEAEPES